MTRLKKMISFLKRHKPIVLVWSFIIIVLSLSGYYFWSVKKLPFANQYFANPAPIPSPTPKLVRAPISGVLVSEDLAKRAPFAASIDNHPDSRPHSGLGKASLVYETLAEGGITRMLAIFQENDAPRIGPVRSARPYFIDWLSEYAAIFAHVGGSSDALNAIVNYGIKDLSEFRWAGVAFWRDQSRWSPHNTYTSTEKLRSGASQSGYPLELNVAPRPFKDDLEKEKRPQTINPIQVNFSTGQFLAGYHYNPETNDYQRYLAGAPYKDLSGEDIRVKNVVVQFTNIVPGYSSAGEIASKITTIGTGKSLIFLDGKTISGTWSKASRTERTKFFDEAGAEIQFNTGLTWIHVVPNTAVVNY